MYYIATRRKKKVKSISAPDTPRTAHSLSLSLKRETARVGPEKYREEGEEEKKKK